MRTKRFDFSYKPLAASSYIEVVGSIPNKQTYDTTTGSYSPDYTINGSALTLQPHVSIYDADGILVSGEVTSSSNLVIDSWKEILLVGTTTTTTVITTSNPNYVITTSGANKGRLQVKRNVPTNGRITLEFNAHYLDSRTNENIQVKCDIAVEVAVDASVVTLGIDKPEAVVWNPIRDPKTMTFKAVLMGANGEIAAANRTLVWEKQRSGGSWSQIGNDAQDDFGWSVASDGSTYTQNMDYIGDNINMRVRVTALNGQAVSDSSLVQYFSIQRRVPKYDYDYVGVPDNIEPDTQYIYPKVMVTDRDGRVENPMDTFDVSWYTGSGTASGSPTMTLIAKGESARLSTAQMNANGMVVGVDLTDRGNYRKVVQDGKLVVQDGKAVIYK